MHTNLTCKGAYKRHKTKHKNKTYNQRTDVTVSGQNEDGVQTTQDTRDKQNIKQNENESTVEVEHQH